MEKELQLGGLENTVKRLTQTENTKEAYELFKDLILASYGEKSEDGKRFVKTKELTESFEQSPALSELIIEFLTTPELGAAFIEATLPAKLVKEVKEAQSKVHPTVQDVELPATSTVQNVELPTAPPVLEGPVQNDPRPIWVREHRDPTQQELTSMSKEELMEAMRKKNQQ